MIKYATSAAAIAMALAAGSAFAADLPSRKDAPVYVPPPVFSWTGFYAGLNVGGGWIESNNGWNNWNNNGGTNAGVVGGGQIGYNYQISPLFVVGIETDFQGTSIGSQRNNGWGGVGGNASLPWFGTVRGRAGIALLDSRLLVYGTGGFAYGEVNSNWNTWWNNNGNNVRTGWTAGGGVEWAFLPNWSAKVEFLHTELTNDNWGWNNGRRVTQVNTIRAGVNYHFNLFTPAPVVAKY